jgi:hypothetical protein
MVDIVMAVERVKLQIGDHLFGGEYLRERPAALIETCNPMHLSYFGYNPFHALEKAGIHWKSMQPFKEATVNFDDPYNRHAQYHGVVPDMILTNDPSAYDMKNAFYPEMAADTAWNRDRYRDYVGGDETAHPPQWARMLMGSGYTSGTRPSDGYGAIEHGYVGLSNGDYLRCYVWEWYNK